MDVWHFMKVCGKGFWPEYPGFDDEVHLHHHTLQNNQPIFKVWYKCESGVAVFTFNDRNKRYYEDKLY